MRRLVTLPVALVAVLLTGVAASAAWMATGTGNAYAQAGQLGQGDTPTAAILDRVPTEPSAGIEVTWGSTENAAGYDVERATADPIVPATLGSACDVRIDGLSCIEADAPEGRWRYRVTPRRGGWTGTPSDWSAPIAVVAAQPSIGTATTVSQTQINVNWTNNSQLQNITQRLEWSTEGAEGPWPPGQSSEVEATSSSFTHTDLACGSTYWYRVRIEHDDPDLTGPYSSTTSASTAACPILRVTSLTGSSTRSGSTWTATATITIGDDNGPFDGAVVSGRWSNYNGEPTGGSPVSCTTGTNGVCAVTSPTISQGGGNPNAVFTVEDVSGPGGATYDPSLNSASDISIPR